MINEDELQRRVQQQYDSLLDHYDENDFISWTTQDGRKMTLGGMTDRHLHNALAYFVSMARRSAELVDTLETHIQEMPNDQGREGFEENINDHLDSIIHSRLIHHAMSEQVRLRAEARSRGEQAGPLTLIERLAKVRETKRETRGLEDHL